MSFSDKQLQCFDCGNTFTFTAGEQEFFATKGFSNDPKRCPECRSARKGRQGSGAGTGGGGSRSSRRPMFQAVCSACGTDTEVPFEPREGRPVYCSSCYTSVKTR